MVLQRALLNVVGFHISGMSWQCFSKLDFILPWNMTVFFSSVYDCVWLIVRVPLWPKTGLRIQCARICLTQAVSPFRSVLFKLIVFCSIISLASKFRSNLLYFFYDLFQKTSSAYKSIKEQHVSLSELLISLIKKRIMINLMLIINTESCRENCILALDPMRWMIFINLPNPSGRTRPWGLLSL
jgi:hypothetical protein